MSWPGFWMEKGWQSRLLWPLSKMVCLVARYRREKGLRETRLRLLKSREGTKTQPPYQNCLSERLSERLPERLPELLPVCVVGNLVVGGSGKTPFIVWLVQQFQAQGVRVGIVSRGYGGRAKTWPQRVYADSDPAMVGDEPVMLAKLLDVPIAVAPLRNQAVSLLSLQTECDFLISDDGLQHWQMARVCELVVMDAQRVVGNGDCLPAGPLREPIDRLQQVQALIWNGDPNTRAAVAFKERMNTLAPELLQVVMQLEPICLRNVLEPEVTLPLEVLRGLPVQAMAGIGNPQRFFQTLQSLGAELSANEFKDHHQFSQEDLMPFALRSTQIAYKDQIVPNALIMTQKDAVKCRTIAQCLQQSQWWYLEVAPSLASKEAEQLLQLVKKRCFQSRLIENDSSKEIIHPK